MLKKEYAKPIVEKLNFNFKNQVVAESGTATNSCYTVNAEIYQKPEPGRDDYRIHVDGKHHASHTSNHQILTISFNMPVTYLSSNGLLRSGDGTPTLVIDYHYYNNPIDNIGLGDIVVNAGQGLAITNIMLND